MLVPRVLIGSLVYVGLPSDKNCVSIKEKKLKFIFNYGENENVKSNELNEISYLTASSP
jgi:hypothetical protein